jgi:[lysine-biosynthesis-protein LysW]--L-2-aminoadipate ligase
MRQNIRSTRFLTEAFSTLAEARQLIYEEKFGGWILRVGDGRRHLGAYGYQLSLNSAVAASIAKDKAAAADRLSSDGLPVIPTLLLLDDKRQRWMDGRGAEVAANETLDTVEYPVVIKPNEGSSGADVRVFHDRNAARSFARLMLRSEPSVCVQPLIELSSEERWVVLDTRPVMRYSKVPVSRADGLPLFNLAMGGSVAECGLETGSVEARRLAIAAAESVGVRIGAVDVVTDRDGRQMVIEVNSGLSFEHLVSTAPELRSTALDVYRQALDAALEG